MRKMTIAMMVLIFLAMVMVMTGCATKPALWSNSYITGKIEVHEEDINSIKAQLNKLEETDKMILAGIEKINANFYPEAATEVATAASNEPEAPPVLKTKKGPVIKVQRLESLVSKSKANIPEEVKSLNTSFGNIMEYMEAWTEEINDRTTKIEERLNVHGRKISDLKRLMAEAEDETKRDKPKKYYFWTVSFKTNSSELTKNHKEGLDMLVSGLLTGEIQLRKEVIGYTDPRGKKKDNEELSKKRAISCIKYLVNELGPDDDVKWQAGTKWKAYFIPVAGGEIDHYGSFKHSRRVRFERN